MADTDNALLKFGKIKITDQAAVTALAVSLFLPYAVSYAVLATLFVAILFNRRTRTVTLKGRSMWLLLAFSSVSLVASFVGGNLLGAICTVGVFAVVTVGLYCMAVMTRELYFNIVKWIFRIMPVVALATVIEVALRFYYLEILCQGVRFGYRCKSFFFNPNYFGAMMAMAALLCIYHFVCFKSQRLKSVCVGACALICLLLSQSVFSCLELLIGAVVLLIGLRRWRYLAVLTVCVIGCALAIGLFPQYVPRVGELGESFDLRLRIWRVAAEAFKEAPVIGQGPLTYFHIYPDYEGVISGVKVWATQHAHNLVIDGLLSYGIVGAALLWGYIATFTVSVVRTLKGQTDRRAGALALAVTVGVLVHGLVDVTVLWSQTGLLFLLIISLSQQERNTV